jgi:hypothetical protein
MNNIGLVIAALMGWQRGREFLAEVDERYIRTFRFAVILTVFGYTAFCGYAAYHQWHAVPSIAYIVVVLLGGLYISLSWQGLAAIAGLSAATKSLTPLRAIGYLALVFAVPTAISEALMLGKITTPHMLFPLYVAGTVLGIYSLLWGGNVWFKRVVVLSAVFLIGKSLVVMYYAPSEAEKVAETLLEQNATQLDRNDAAYIATQGGFAEKARKGELTDEQKRKLQFAANGEPVHKRVASYVEERLGVVTVEYKIPQNIADEKKVCGIPPGEYEFTLVGNPFITVATPSIEIYSLTKQGGFRSDLPLPYYNAFGVLLNGSPTGSTVVVGSDGCASVTFNISEIMSEQFANGSWEAKPLTLHITLK